jgi:exopolysaccharide biosynthesis polyprenyl glycosylphosphotransferase
MNNVIYKKATKLIMIICDIILIHLGILTAFYVRFDGQWPQMNIDAYVKVAPWISLFTFIIFYLFDFYSNWNRKSSRKFMYSILLALTLLSICIMAISFWYRGFAFPRSVILLASFCYSIYIVGLRSIAWYVQKSLRGKKKVIVIGNELEEGFQVTDKVLKHVQGWFEVKGIIHVEDIKDIHNYLHEIDVVLISPSVSKELKSRIISTLFPFEKEILIVPELYELFLMESEIQQIDDMPVMSIVPAKLSTFDRVLKRMFDLSVAIGMLVIFSPIMLALIFLIPLISTGPAIYTQERIGLNGSRYMVYKFRSMVHNAENSTGPVLAKELDHRITQIGSFIRSTRLDELPQLYNVIKGDMSMVGPRPERDYFIQQFKESIPDYMYRMSVKPGITGLAQVMAKYSTTVEDKLRYDLMYIRNYSFLIDLKILLQTIVVVLQRDQSSGIKQSDEENRNKELGKLLLSAHLEVAAVRESK